MGGMRTLGRRASIGATTVALLFAATGSSLAAVRASRYDGGVASSGVALPAPSATPAGPDSDAALPPTADVPPLAPDSGVPFVPGTTDTPTGSPPPAEGAPAPPPASPTAPAPAPGPAPARQQPSATPPAGSDSVTVPTLGPSAGPTPTTGPIRPTSISCPTNGVSGALPTRTGELQAVNFSLPVPGSGPLVLAPQASATRAPDTPVRIQWSSVGEVDDAGSMLTLENPLPIASLEYTLAAGQDRARGSIRFTSNPPADVKVEHRACRDRLLTIYDVDKRSQNGSPLRIVGMVAATSSVTVDEGGGAAHFRAAQGTHHVTLVTASDDGAAGPLVRVTVTIP